MAETQNLASLRRVGAITHSTAGGYNNTVHVETQNLASLPSLPSLQFLPVFTVLFGYGLYILISLVPAQEAMSCLLRAAAIRSGNLSGVQANTGMPIDAKKPALL